MEILIDVDRLEEFRILAAYILACKGVETQPQDDVLDIALKRHVLTIERLDDALPMERIA